MSLDSIKNVVLLFSNPTWVGSTEVPSTIIRNITAISGNIAYSQQITENITTLTSRYAEVSNGVIQGLLYVPDLDLDDPCQLLLKDFVPPSAVRQSNLPPTNYNLVALAPWITPGCTQSFLASARLDPLRAMIFYHPGSGLDQPPPPSSDQWSLNDEGVWKANNHFPVYAVSGEVGQQMMDALSSYSGELEDIPFAQNISDLYHPNPEDYVRIWTELKISSRTTPTNLWAFLLAILGVLLFIVVAISALMHWVQSRRRAALRAGIMRGEVNLEALGIKRLTVPMSHIQTFPLFTYHYEGDDQQQLLRHREEEQQRRHQQQQQQGAAAGSQTTNTHDLSEKGAPQPQASHPPSPPPPPEPPPAPAIVVEPPTSINYQPRCIICLEAFENRVTIIRELPCGHIFHPDCVDEFLSVVSSLCPVCKASMLPLGSCPTRITNAMVRRERAVRELRRRIVVVDEEEEEHDGDDVEASAGVGGAASRRRRTMSTTRGHARVKSWGSSVRGRLFGSGKEETEGGGGGGGGGSRRTEEEDSDSLEGAVVRVVEERPDGPPPPPPPPPPQAAGAGGSSMQQQQPPPEDEETTRRRLRERMRQLAGPSPEPQEGKQGEAAARYQWGRMFRSVFPGFR